MDASLYLLGMLIEAAMLFVKSPRWYQEQSAAERVSSLLRQIAYILNVGGCVTPAIFAALAEALSKDEDLTTRTSKTGHGEVREWDRGVHYQIVFVSWESCDGI